MRSFIRFLSLATLVLLFGLQAPPVHGMQVNITPELSHFMVKHGRVVVRIQRNHDIHHTVTPFFSKTSRRCPPFCAQPMEVAPGVKTMGELELFDFMRTLLADGKGLLIDARTPDWHRKGTIPGSINIPYINLLPSMGADEFTIKETLNRFGVTRSDDGEWDFSQAKSLVLWCNGPWCGQSPSAIRGLLTLGYPREKLFYYRGGMQMWEIFGLTVVPPAIP